MHRVDRPACTALRALKGPAVATQGCDRPARTPAGFVVVTDEAAGRTIPSAFLDKVKEEFMIKYAEKGKQMKEGGLTSFRCGVCARDAE